MHIKALPDEVIILFGHEIVAKHARSYQRGVVIYQPLHYLALLEQKPNALDQAAPLQGWRLLWIGVQF
jgi:hypothetical protein